MKLHYRMMILLVIVASMAVIFGCGTNEKLSESADVKGEKTIGSNEKNVLGVSEDIKKVTATQLNQITKDITNREVVNALGNSKDIGSGRYIFRYKFENDELLDIKFVHYDQLISEENYLAIQNMLKETT